MGEVVSLVKDEPQERLVTDVASHLVPHIWPKCEPHIKRALDRTCGGAYLPVDILIAVLKGEMRLWVSAVGTECEAAMVTRIVDYPRKRTCNVFLIGGRNMSGWAEEFSQKVEAHARSLNCHAMEGGARQGWSRVAGYTVTGCVLVKEL